MLGYNLDIAYNKDNRYKDGLAKKEMYSNNEYVMSCNNYKLRGDQTFTFSFDVPAGTFHYRYGYIKKGTGLIGHFEVTSGNDVTFFIVDSENFDKLTSGESGVCYLLHEKIRSLDWKFRIPYSDTWYIIYDNRYSIITTKHVEGWDGYDLTPPQITININDNQVVMSTITISASASDNHFDVYYLEIQIDGFYIKHVYYSDSISYVWDTTEYSNGYHTIKIIAGDNVGNYGSKVINVYVNNPTPTTTTTTTTTTESDDDSLVVVDNSQAGAYGSKPSSLGPLFLLGFISFLVGCVIYLSTRRKAEYSL